MIFLNRSVAPLYMIVVLVLTMGRTYGQGSVSIPVKVIRYPTGSSTGYIYSDERILLVIDRPDWLGRTVEVKWQGRLLAHATLLRQSDGKGYVAFARPDGWNRDNARYLLSMTVTNGPRNLVVAAPIYQSGQRPSNASGLRQVHYDNARRLADASLATIPLYSYKIVRHDVKKGKSTADTNETLPQLEKLPDAEGSAVLLSKDGVLVTCDHVVHDADICQFLYQGKLYLARKIYGEKAAYWAAHDVVFLRTVAPVDTDLATSLPIFVTGQFDLRPQSVAIPTLLKNQSPVLVQALGYPSSDRATLQALGARVLSIGQIVRFVDKHGVETDENAAATHRYDFNPGLRGEWDTPLDALDIKGMSGGAVINKQGWVVGILHSTRPDIISIDVIRRALDDIGIRKKIKPQSVLPQRTWEEASAKDEAIPPTLEALEQLSNGKVREAAEYLGRALNQAKLSSVEVHRIILLLFEQLGSAGCPKIVQIVQHALADPKNNLVAPNDVATLIGIASKYQALPRSIVISGLDGNNKQAVIEASLAALGSLEDLSFTTPLEYDEVRDLLNDWWISPQALSTLGRLCRKSFAQVVQKGSVSKPRPEGSWRQEVLNSIMATLLDSPNDRMRKAASEVVRDNGGAGVIEGLTLNIYKGKDTYPAMTQRSRALEALGWIGGSRAMSVLREVLVGPSPEQASHYDSILQEAAARALGVNGTNEAIDILSDAMNSPNESLRHITADGLSLVGTHRAISAISQSLVNHRPPTSYPPEWPELRALVSIGTSETADELLRLVKEHVISKEAIELSIGAYASKHRIGGSGFSLENDPFIARLNGGGLQVLPSAGEAPRPGSAPDTKSLLQIVDRLVVGIEREIRSGSPNSVSYLQEARYDALRNSGVTSGVIAIMVLERFARTADDKIAQALLLNAPGRWLALVPRDNLRVDNRRAISKYLAP